MREVEFQDETQDPSTPVSAPQEPTPSSWGPRISRAGENAREPSSAQDDTPYGLPGESSKFEEILQVLVDC